MSKNKNASPARLILSLFVICLIVGVCLALANYYTKDQIAAASQQKMEAAMSAVLEADSYDQVDYSGSDIVTAAYKAGESGWVVRVAPSGFGGAIDMMVGVDNDGAVTGVAIIKMTETAGLGAKASDEAFIGQFVGKSGTVTVTKDGGEIDAITGATITSRAVSKGVTAALDAAESLKGVG